MKYNISGTVIFTSANVFQTCLFLLGTAYGWYIEILPYPLKYENNSNFQ